MTKKRRTADVLRDIYERLYNCFGPQGWWPAETPFEVIIGAILTQNTAWTNVEKAIDNLKSKKILTPAGLRNVSIKVLAELIRPAGYYNIKAVRIKNFINFLFDRYNGRLERMFKTELFSLREQLLEVNGIGPETADSIILYAGRKPVFVIDAYTRRIFSRHKLIDDSSSYSQVQEYFMSHLPPDTDYFNEYHALIVHLAKTMCRNKPDCNSCPLKALN